MSFITCLIFFFAPCVDRAHIREPLTNESAGAVVNECRHVACTCRLLLVSVRECVHVNDTLFRWNLETSCTFLTVSFDFVFLFLFEKVQKVSCLNSALAHGFFLSLDCTLYRVFSFFLCITCKASFNQTLLFSIFHSHREHQVTLNSLLLVLARWNLASVFNHKGKSSIIDIMRRKGAHNSAHNALLCFPFCRRWAFWLGCVRHEQNTVGDTTSRQPQVFI